MAKIYWTLGLLALVVLSRLLPHTWNLTPTMAIVLFSGAAFGMKSWLGLVPFAGVFISDALLGFYPGASFVYFSYALIYFGGTFLGSRLSWPSVVGTSLSASLLFFFLSNLGVFLTTPLYEKSWHGFVQCYVAALPFYRASLLGDVLFSVVLFGAAQLSGFLKFPALSARKL